MKEMHIVVENVGKRFGDRWLFEHINAGILPGQCLGITGHNGSGKSTLLKIVAGLIRPTQGRVRFFSNDSGREINLKEGLTGIGLVAPDMSMYTALTGVENILFWTKVRGIAYSPGEAADFCLQLGLDRIAAGQQVQTYSTGMRQRLKLAVLVAINPAIWLLDEPSTNLDNNGKALVGELVASAVRRKAVVLLATNEPEEAGYASTTVEL